MPGTDDIKLSWYSWSWLFLIFLGASLFVKFTLNFSVILVCGAIFKDAGFDTRSAAQAFQIWDIVSWGAFLVFGIYILYFFIKNAQKEKSLRESGKKTEIIGDDA